MEEKKTEAAGAESVCIEQRKRIEMRGVSSVDGFTPKEIRVSLEGGRAVIEGDGLKIVGFSKPNGTLAAAGKIEGIRFYVKGEKLVKRLFG